MTFILALLIVLPVVMLSFGMFFLFFLQVRFMHESNKSTIQLFTHDKGGGDIRSIHQ